MLSRLAGCIHQKLKTLLTVLAVLVTATALMPAVSLGAPVKNVLVLHSYHQGFKWTDEITRGINTALRGNSLELKIRYEYMDTKRVSSPAYFQLLYETYRSRYLTTGFDVIIAADNNAFDFLKKYRDTLFPLTPVVFCGVNDFKPSQLEGATEFTGVNEAIDVKATIDLALRLQPDTRQIAVIIDDTTTGKIVQKDVRLLVPDYQGKVSFTFLEGDLPEILGAVQRLGPGSVVFYGLYFRDRSGTFYDYDEAISLVARNSRVPIYGVWDYNLGYGVLGGMMTSGYYQGETGGRMALRILQGEKAEAIPVVMKSPNRYMFDFKQLKRFRLSASSLPEGSIIINRPSYLYSVRKEVVWGVVAALFVSLLIISFLLFTMAIRRKAERELHKAAVKYRIVADNTYNWEFWLDHEGRFLYTSPSCERITGHAAAEFHADAALLERIVHPDDKEKFTGHLHDRGTRVSALEFRILREDGETRWLHHVCLPVFEDNGAFLGTRASNTDISERKRAEERSLRLAAIVDSSDDAIIGKTLEGTITSWNKGAEKIFGYSESAMLGKPVTVLIPAEHHHEVRQLHQKIQEGEHIEHFETVRIREDGAQIYMSITYSPVIGAHGETVAISSIGRDITELKKAQELLLENAGIKRELEIAQQIQQSFLTPCPLELPGLLMACCCLPATHVGGDYYDYFTPEPGVVDLVIADITGHSIGAALLMTETRSVLHAKVHPESSPAEILAAVNDLLYDDLSRAELQISMFYARFDAKKGTLAFANAGHNRPLLYRSNAGKLEELDAEGILLGIMTGMQFEGKVIGVDTSDLLLMYTDGVVEMENPKGDQFGLERLGKIVAAQSREHPNKLLEAILQGTADFSAGKTRVDDVTMVAAKVA